MASTITRPFHFKGALSRVLFSMPSRWSYAKFTIIGMLRYTTSYNHTNLTNFEIFGRGFCAITFTDQVGVLRREENRRFAEIPPTSRRALLCPHHSPITAKCVTRRGTLCRPPCQISPWPLWRRPVMQMDNLPVYSRTEISTHSSKGPTCEYEFLFKPGSRPALPW